MQQFSFKDHAGYTTIGNLKDLTSEKVLDIFTNQHSLDKVVELLGNLLTLLEDQGHINVVDIRKIVNDPTVAYSQPEDVPS